MDNPDQRRGQAGVRGDDDDAEDRHRQDRGGASAARPSMRKLTGAVFLSLDGVMQAPGGPEEDPTSDFRFGGWVQPFWGEQMGPFEDVIMGEYDLLLGKRTYDIFAAYWPYNQDNPIGEKFQRINKYVLTHSDEPLEWDNSQRLSGDTADCRCRTQAKRRPRPAHPGQQHALRAAARGRTDRPAGPDDLSRTAGPGQADLRRIAGARRIEDGRPFRVGQRRDRRQL